MFQGSSGQSPCGRGVSWKHNRAFSPLGATQHTHTFFTHRKKTHPRLSQTRIHTQNNAASTETRPAPNKTQTTVIISWESFRSPGEAAPTRRGEAASAPVMAAQVVHRAPHLRVYRPTFELEHSMASRRRRCHYDWTAMGLKVVHYARPRGLEGGIGGKPIIGGLAWTWAVSKKVVVRVAGDHWL